MAASRKKTALRDLGFWRARWREISDRTRPYDGRVYFFRAAPSRDFLEMSMFQLLHPCGERLFSRGSGSMSRENIATVSIGTILTQFEFAFDTCDGNTKTDNAR